MKKIIERLLSKYFPPVNPEIPWHENGEPVSGMINNKMLISILRSKDGKNV